MNTEPKKECSCLVKCTDNQCIKAWIEQITGDVPATPETDAVRISHLGKGIHATYSMAIDHACRLERQRNEAYEAIRKIVATNHRSPRHITDLAVIAAERLLPKN